MQMTATFYLIDQDFYSQDRQFSVEYHKAQDSDLT